MSVFMSISKTHMQLAWRGGHSGLAMAFLFIAVTLLPFGLGPELKLLRALAPGLLWVVLVMSVLVTLDRLFQEDFEDGTLDQLSGLDLALEAVILAKLVGHYLAIIVPLLICVPLAGLLLNIAPSHLPALMMALGLGTPALVLLGGIGAALAVSVQRGGLLSVLLTLPFYVPVMIFGAAASKGALEGAVPMATLGIVAALSLAGLCLAPIAIAAALRAAMR